MHTYMYRPHIALETALFCSSRNVPTNLRSDDVVCGEEKPANSLQEIISLHRDLLVV